MSPLEDVNDNEVENLCIGKSFVVRRALGVQVKKHDLKKPTPVLRENLERDALLLHGVDSTICAGGVWILNFSWLPCLHSTDLFPSPSSPSLFSFSWFPLFSFFFPTCTLFQMAKNK